MASEVIIARQAARAVSITSTIVYLCLLGVIIFELMVSLTSGRPSPILGFELSIFIFFLILSCISAIGVAILSRYKPSLHHARKHLGEHIRRFGNNELHEHLKHRH